jgi:hypothetical protein
MAKGMASEACGREGTATAAGGERGVAGIAAPATVRLASRDGMEDNRQDKAHHERPRRYAERGRVAVGAATEPKTPKALPRSRGSVNVLTRVPRADGARTAPNAPCSARAVTSTANELAAPPIAEAVAGL